MQILFGRSLIDTLETKHTICRFVGLTYNENHDNKFQACYRVPKIVNSNHALP